MKNLGGSIAVLFVLFVGMGMKMADPDQNLLDWQSQGPASKFFIIGILGVALGLLLFIAGNQKKQTNQEK